MKTLVAQKSLLSAIKTASRAMGRSNLPILENAKVCVRSAGVEITGTDLDNTVTVRFDDMGTIAGEHAEGETTVPAKRFAETVKACKDSIRLEESNGSLAIVNGSTFNLATLPAADFPNAGAIVESGRAQVCSDALRKALVRLESAMSTDCSRYVLQGIYFEFDIENECLNTVATDGRRLHVQSNIATSCQCEKPETGKPGFILPANTVKILLATLPKKGTEIVRLVWGDLGAKGNENQACSFEFLAGGQTITIQAKLINGNFPCYRQVIPRDSLHAVMFEPSALKAKIQAAAIGTTDKANSVKLHFTRHHLAITSNAPGVAQCAADLACNFEGTEAKAEFAIAFNPRYLCEALESAEDIGTITLQLVDELSPVKITGDSFLAVIMPMRLA